MNQLADSIVDAVVKEIRTKLMVEVEASGRHVHLSREDVEALFGAGYRLTRSKDLSQPGQFACEERVSITGPKGTIKNVVILGPERSDTQAEISMTDARTLGINAPVRLSGDIEGTPGMILSNKERQIVKDKGVIVAKRHLHITPEDAARFQVKDKDIIKIKVFGSRPVVLEDTIVRVSSEFHTDMHIDYDEANACGYRPGTYGRILGQNEK